MRSRTSQLKALPLLAFASVALADETILASPDQQTPLTPLRAARVVQTPDGRIELVGPWIELGNAAPRSRFGRVFDCYFGEHQSMSVPNLPLFSNDMTTNARGVGAEATKVGFAFGWEGDGNNGAAQCYVLIETYENFAGCAAPTPNPGSGLLDAIVVDFGSLGPTGWYATEVDLTGTGLDLPMPADGHGAYLMAYLHELDPAELAVGAHPLFSNTGEDDDPPTDRPGTQTADEFHDDDPADGDLSASECYNLDLPPEVGVAIYFETKSECACTGDVDEDGDVDLTDLALLLARFGLSAPFDYPCADVNNNGSIGLPDLTLLQSNFGEPC